MADIASELHAIIPAFRARLVRAVQDRADPTRIFALISSAKELADGRMVVLRGFDAERDTLTFYTDARSPKVQQLANQPTCVALFYDHAQRLQIRCVCQAKRVLDKNTIDQAWQSVTGAARTNYQTAQPPGEALEDDSIELLGDGRPNFAVFECEIRQIDWLDLKSTPHQRVHLQKQQGQWVAETVVP